MKNELDYVSQRLLNALCEEAPKMQLSKAMNFCREYQELRDCRELSEFVIMMLFTALGFDSTGYLRDKQIAEKLKTADEKVWMAINEALKIHGGYACSPFTPDNWADKVVKKFELDNLSYKSMRDSQLHINFPEEYQE